MTGHADERFEKRCVISGVGLSKVGRRLGRSGLDLTIDAVSSAIADAGLVPQDIDGLVTWPGGGPGGATDGFTGPNTWDVKDAFRFSLNWHAATGVEGPSQLGSLVSACLAVANRLATHVVVYRAVTEASDQGTGGRRPTIGAASTVGGWAQWSVPFGAVSGACRVALLADRHFTEFGTTREQLGMLAVVQRENAVLNPDAVYRDRLSLADYLESRIISSPLCLYDCDVPVDGAVAVVISPAERAADTRRPAVSIDAFGTAIRARPSFDQFDDLSSGPPFDAARHLWSRSSVGPADVDVAQLYDGFSFGTLIWLEALGFCGPGESGNYVAGGHRICRDGELPVNTGGGQLSAGRLSGFGHIYEAVVQLRGDAGNRQVAGRPQVAVVTNGLGPIAGAMTLTCRP